MDREPDGKDFRVLVVAKKFSCTTCRFLSMHSLPLVLHRNGLLYVCHNYSFVLFRLKAHRYDWGFESEGRFRWIGSQVGRMSEFGRLEKIQLYNLQISVNALPAPRIAQKWAFICVPQFFFCTFSIKSS